MIDSMGGYRFALALCVLAMLGCLHQLRAPTSALVNVSPTNDPSANLAKLPDSLVYVRVFCRRSESKPDVTGTAFVVGHSDGWSYLVSARHVLFPRECGLDPLSGKPSMAQRVELRGEGVRDFDGEAQPLIQLQTRPEDDLILLRARGDKRTPAVELGVLNTDMLGNEADPMEAFGFSMLQGSGSLPLHENRRGSVSKSLRGDTYQEVLTTSAKLLPSMSGGPVALRSSGLVFGVVLGEYEAQKGASREGRIASLTPLIDLLPEALRQQLGIVLHFPVSAARQPDKPKSTWVERPEQANVLAVLDAAKPGMEPARVLLHGIGGVGKTTLAYQVAAQRQARFPGGMVKIELTDRPSDVVLDELLEAMTGHKVPSGDRFKLLRALLANRPPTLVILDNVRLDSGPWSDPATMDALLQAVSPATLVMTSRSPKAPENFVAVPVASLPERPATELVLKLSRYQSLAMGESEAAELARLLGGLPFALKRAIELMQSEHYSAQSLLLKLRHEGRDPDGRLAKLLDWSYEPLDDDAKAVLVAMGQLAEAPVPEVLLAGLLPQNNRAQGIKRLIRSGLLERSEERPGVFIYHQHSLLREWARQLGTERHQAEIAAIQQRITDSLKTHDEQVAPLLITHLLTAQRLAEEQKQWDRVLGLWWGTQEVLSVFGYRGAEKELLQRSLKAAQRGMDRQLIAYIQLNLGSVAAQQGDYEAARNFYEPSLDVAHALGNRKLIAAILCNLGIMAQAQGDHESAHRFFQQSLDLAQAQSDRKGIATVLLSMGNLAAQQGGDASAHTYYKQSMDLAQTVGDRQLFSESLLALSEMARQQGDDEAARKLSQQSLDLAQALGDRRLTAKNLFHLGGVATSQAEYEAARKFYQQCLNLAEALGDHQLIAGILNNFGIWAYSQGEYEAARKFHQQSLDLAQALGLRSAIGRALWGRARVAAKTGLKAEARQMLDHAIRLFAALGDPHLDYVQKDRAALGDAPDPVECRKTCDELQAKGDLAVPIAECVQKLCAD